MTRPTLTLLAIGAARLLGQELIHRIAKELEVVVGVIWVAHVELVAGCGCKFCTRLCVALSRGPEGLRTVEHALRHCALAGFHVEPDSGVNRRDEFGGVYGRFGFVQAAPCCHTQYLEVADDAVGVGSAQGVCKVQHGALEGDGRPVGQSNLQVVGRQYAVLREIDDFHVELQSLRQSAWVLGWKARIGLKFTRLFEVA